MLEQRMIFSEERGTWNLFVDNEWFYEGTYEECSDRMFNNAVDSNEDDYEEYDREIDLAEQAAFYEVYEA